MKGIFSSPPKRHVTVQEKLQKDDLMSGKSNASLQEIANTSRAKIQICRFLNEDTLNTELGLEPGLEPELETGFEPPFQPSGHIGRRQASLFS